MELAQVYPPTNCFCYDFHTEESFYYAEGQYFDADTKEPIITLCELEGYPLNYVRNLNPLFDDDAAERSDFDECYLDTHNSSNIYPISECVFQSPVMAHQNLVVAPGEGNNGGALADQADRDMAVDLVEGDSPYNRSKSLVTGKKGFSPFFKSKARDELGRHCTDLILLMHALTLNESYEAVTICRLVAIHGSGRPGILADLVWIPLSLRNQTLAELRLRFDFLLGKAKLTPNADQWKSWSRAYKKVHISKNQKKRQQ